MSFVDELVLKFAMGLLAGAAARRQMGDAAAKQLLEPRRAPARRRRRSPRRRAPALAPAADVVVQGRVVKDVEESG